MYKVSSAKVAEVLQDAATCIRTQQALIGELTEKVAAHDRHDRAVKVASDMQRKNLCSDEDVDSLVDRLEKAAAAGNLETIEQAVGLVGPDMSDKIASLTNYDEPGHSVAGSELERFIIGTAG